MTTQPSFPKVTRAQWQAKAGEELGGRSPATLTRRTADGIDVAPLSMREDASASEQRPAQRGWWTMAELRHADVAAANAAARRDIELGANAVLFVLDGELRAGRSSSATPDGLVAEPERDLAALLDGIDARRTPVLFEAGVLAPRWADVFEQWLDDHASTDGPERAELGRGPRAGGAVYDPIAALVGSGRLERELDEALAGTVDAVLGMRAGVLGISTAVYHDAGASEADELALGLAGCAELLRRGEPLGLEFADLDGAMMWTLAVAGRPFEAIAKLRAARVLWAKFGAALGHGEAAPWIHARCSQRLWTRHAPWVNLLRGTVASFAAAVGGADSVATAPFDGLCGPEQDAADGLGRGSELGRRLAVNTQVMLREESGLDRVIDPAGGSGTVEALTDALARAAWQRFREIEREGGLIEGLMDGRIQARIESQAARLREQVATRKLAITGVSTYPILADEPTPKQSANTAAVPANGSDAAGGSVSVKALTCERLAAPFERLRDAAAQHERRPSMFACKLGPLTAHQARLDFARNCFGAAGIELCESETQESLAAAMRASGCAIAIICGSDADYPRMVAPALAALREGGARAVWVAGRPPDDSASWPASWGLTAESLPRFVFLGANVLTELEHALAGGEG